MPGDKTFHMTPEEFRRHGHAVVDWLADYLASVPERPVTPAVKPGDVAALLPAVPPEEGDGFATLLADLVAAGLGTQGMLWSTGPACTEVETVMLDWLAQLLDLPAAFRSAHGG